MADPIQVRASDKRSTDNKGREFMVISLKTGIVQALVIVGTIVTTVVTGAFGIWGFLQEEITEVSDSRDNALRNLVATVTNDVSRLTVFVENNAKADEIIRSDMFGIKSDMRSIVEQQTRQLEITREESLRVNDLEAYVRDRLNQIALAMNQSELNISHHTEDEHNVLNNEITELKTLITNEITQRNLMDRDIAELERLLDQIHKVEN